MKRFLTIAVVATVALLSACDSDSDSGNDAATSTPVTAVTNDEATMTDADFFEQVNVICAAHNQAIGGVIGPLFSSAEPTPEAMQGALDEIVVLSRQLSADIDALAQPSALDDEVTALIDALNRGNDEAASQSGPEFFGSEDDPWAEATALAQDFGLPACSGEGG